MNLSLVGLLLMSALAGTCHGAKILAVVTMASRSHTHIFERLLTELEKRGHDITFITPFPRHKDATNITQISVNELFNQFQDSFDLFNMGTVIPVIIPSFMSYMAKTISDQLYALPQIQEFIKKDDHYDLIICEAFFNEGFVSGITHKFQAPAIHVQIFLPNLWARYRVGNPTSAAYLADPTLGYYTKMNFWERMGNAGFQALHELYYRFSILPYQEQLMRENFGRHGPPLMDILKNTSAMLVYHHFSLAYPRPYVPNMIEVGGMHVSPTPNKLPQDIQKFLDEAEHGAIFFSLGSNAKSASMPKDRLDLILKVFSNLKQRILWKFENDTLPGKPENVMIGKWLPQSDILAHINLKLLITHGGLLSTTEAVYRGVPIVGVPIFAEQPMNMEQAELAGFAKKIDFRTMTAEDFQGAIQEVLEDPKYRINVQKRSALLKDTPLSAMETAIFWVEYVIRHKGAGHMRSASLDLSWIQLYLIDVYFVLISSLVVVLYVCKCLFRIVSRKVRRVVSKEKKTN